MTVPVTKTRWLLCKHSVGIFNRNQGNKETSVFQANASRFSLIAAKNQLVSDVDRTWISYAQPRRLSDPYTSNYLKETKDMLSIAQLAFKHGGIALIDYLDNRLRYRDHQQRGSQRLPTNIDRYSLAQRGDND